MAKIVEVWENLKAYIDEECREYGKYVLFFEPYTQDKYEFSVKRGSKFIIGTTNKGAAEELKEGIAEFLEREENLINDQKTQKKKPYRLNVKILDGAAQHIVLRRNSAHSTLTCSIDGVMDYLSDKVDECALLERQEDEKEFREALSRVAAYKIQTGDTHVYLTKFSGAAYKVNYFDCNEMVNKQINLGDILIIVGATELSEIKKPNRRRSDALNRNSEGVIAAANYILVRELPEEIKERLRREAEEKAKAEGKA